MRRNHTKSEHVVIADGMSSEHSHAEFIVQGLASRTAARVPG